MNLIHFTRCNVRSPKIECRMVQLLLISAWGLCLRHIYISRSDRPLAAMTLINDRDRSPSLNVFMWHVVRSAVKTIHALIPPWRLTGRFCCTALYVARCWYQIWCHLIRLHLHYNESMICIVAFQGIEYLTPLWCFLESIEKRCRFCSYEHWKMRTRKRKPGLATW